MIVDVIRPSTEYYGVKFSASAKPKIELINAKWVFKPKENINEQESKDSLFPDLTGAFYPQTDDKVPDYRKAIQYYLDDVPHNKRINDFDIASPPEQIARAYEYIWQGFQQEVNKTLSEWELGLALNMFNGFVNDLDRYKSIQEFIKEEREQLLKPLTNPEQIREQIQFRDRAEEILKLLRCLFKVTEIISDGQVLIKKRLKQYENLRNREPIESEGFDRYIKDEFAQKLMPYLKEHFTNKKSKDLCPMLYALEKLQILKMQVDKCTITYLHKALEITFGNIGSRSAFNDGLSDYDPDPAKKSPDLNKRLKIDRYRTQIESFLKAF
ncbi:hypothetical protein GCM10027592_31640 [Spirosoma flavus]